DYMSVTSADQLPNGICVCLGFSEMKMNGTFSSIGRDPKSAVYEHYLGIYYLPKDSAHAISRTADLTTEIFPYYSHVTYNSFARSLNVLLLSYKDVIYRYGLELQPSALTAMLFFKMDEDNGDLQHNWINNTMATDYLKQ